MQFLFPAVILLLAIHITPAFAADAAAKDLKFSTREEFRACLDLQDKAEAQRKSYEEHVAESRGVLLLIQHEATALVEDQRNLNAQDEQQIEAFNKRTEEHNKRVKAANDQVEKLKAEQESFNTASLLYNKRCAAVVVKVADRDAVMKERSAAAKQTASVPQAPPTSKPPADEGSTVAVKKQL